MNRGERVAEARRAAAPPRRDGWLTRDLAGSIVETMGILTASPTDLRAPDRCAVELSTTKGPVLIELDRALAPLGVDRFYSLVRLGFFQRVAFFRVVLGFVAQAGIHGDPAVSKVWRKALLEDDPVRAKNLEGTVTFATSGKNSRTTQFFINLKDNSRLDGMGFAPIGRARDLSAARALNSQYGDSPPSGQGPLQGRIQREGNGYLEAEFEHLDYILGANIV